MNFTRFSKPMLAFGVIVAVGVAWANVGDALTSFSPSALSHAGQSDVTEPASTGRRAVAESNSLGAASSISLVARESVTTDLIDGAIIALQCKDTNGGYNYFFNGPARKSPELGWEQLWRIVGNEDGTFLLQRLSDNSYVGRNGNTLTSTTKGDAAKFTATGVSLSSWTSKPESIDPETAPTIRFITDDTFLNAQPITNTPAYTTGPGGYSGWYVYKFTTELADEFHALNEGTFDPEPIEALKGKYIMTGQSPVTQIVTPGWYILQNVNHQGYVKQEGDAWMMRECFGNPQGASAEENAGYLFYVSDATFGDYANRVYLTSGYGSYFGLQQSSSSVCLFPREYTIDAVPGTTNKFYFQDMVSSKVSNANPIGQSLVGWTDSAPTAEGTNADFYFYRVALVDDPSENPPVEIENRELVAYDRSTWTFTGCSQMSEPSGGDGPFSAMIDDNTETWWHQDWRNDASTLPHFFAINMDPSNPDEAYDIAAFGYKPRAGSENGVCTGYRLYVVDSIDGLTMLKGADSHASLAEFVSDKTPAASGTLNTVAGGDEVMVILPKVAQGHYVIFVIDETLNGAAHGTCGNFNLYYYKPDEEYSSDYDNIRQSYMSMFDQFNEVGLCNADLNSIVQTVKNKAEYDLAVAKLDSIKNGLMEIVGSNVYFRNAAGNVVSQVPADTAKMELSPVQEIDANSLWIVQWESDSLKFRSDATHVIMHPQELTATVTDKSVTDFFVAPEVSTTKYYKLMSKRSMTVSAFEESGRYLSIPSVMSAEGTELQSAPVNICSYWRLVDAGDGKVILQNAATLTELGSASADNASGASVAQHKGVPHYIIKLDDISDLTPDIEQSYCISTEKPYSDNSCLDQSSNKKAFLNTWSPSIETGGSAGSVWYFVAASDAEVAAVSAIAHDAENGTIQQRFESELAKRKSSYISGQELIPALYPAEMTAQAINALGLINGNASACESMAEVDAVMESVHLEMIRIMDPVFKAADGAVVNLQNCLAHTYDSSIDSLIESPVSAKGFLGVDSIALTRSYQPYDNCRWELIYQGENKFTLYNRETGYYIGKCMDRMEVWPSTSDVLQAGLFRIHGVQNQDSENIINLELVESTSDYRFIHEAGSSYDDLPAHAICAWDNAATASNWTLTVVDRVSHRGDNELVPNLDVYNVDIAGDPVAGLEVEVSWTLTNKGDTTAVAPWSQYVWVVKDLSKSFTVENGAHLLATVSNSTDIEVNEAVENRVKIVLPENQVGKYYIVVVADARDVSELFSAYAPDGIWPDECPEDLIATVVPDQRQLLEPDADVTLTDNIFYKTVRTAQLIAEDWDVLEHLNSLPATPIWENMADGRFGTVLANIDVEKGRVTGLEMTDVEFNSELPAEVFGLSALTWFSLHHTGLHGDINARLTDSHILPNVKSVYLSHNALTGNVGMFAARFPKLNLLYADHNSLSDVLPMPSNTATLYLYNQTLTDTIDVDLRVLAANPMSVNLPTVFSYPMSIAFGRVKYLVQDIESGVTIGSVDCNQSSIPVAQLNSSYNTVFRGANGSAVLIRASESKNGLIDNCTVPARLTFGMGDANFNGRTDVVDLQSMISYSFNEYYRSFNFTAANLYDTDDRINVQDVVRMADLLLADNSVPATARGAAGHDDDQDEMEASDAAIYWQDGKLMLYSAKEVAAIDIVVDADASLRWSRMPAGMTITSKRDSLGRSHSVIYSAAGAAFPVGETVLATSSASEMPRVLRVEASDASADYMMIGRDRDGVTSILTPEMTGVSVVADNQGCIYVNGLADAANYVVATVDGRVISTGSAEPCGMPVCIAENVGSGIVIIRLSVANKGVYTFKIKANSTNTNI